jgi:hypothetical protein
MNTQTRPTFSTAGLPEFAKARMAAKAAASWCYVTDDGRDFYVSEAQAKAMLAAHGGTVFAPEA